MFNRIVKVAMASREALNNAAKAVPVDTKAREDLHVREAQGIPTHPAQKATISGSASVTPAPAPAQTLPKTPADPNVRTLEQAKNPYPAPVKQPSLENILRGILNRIGVH